MTIRLTMYLTYAAGLGYAAHALLTTATTLIGA